MGSFEEPRAAPHTGTNHHEGGSGAAMAPWRREPNSSAGSEAEDTKGNNVSALIQLLESWAPMGGMPSVDYVDGLDADEPPSPSFSSDSGVLVRSVKRLPKRWNYATASPSPSCSHSEDECGHDLRGHAPSYGAAPTSASDSPSQQQSRLVSLLPPTESNQAQATARLLFPLWPHSRHSQELALFRMNGVRAQDILAELEASGASAAAPRSSRFRNRSVGPLSGRSEGGRNIRPALRSPHTTQMANSRSQNSDTDVGPEVAMRENHNNKKRKSSRSGMDTFASTGSSFHQGSRWSPSSSEAESDAESVHDGSRSEEHVERPDVSANTFRASRIVDELFMDGGGDACDSDDGCECCAAMQQSKAAQAVLSRRQARLMNLPLCETPWSNRPNLSLRAHMRSRILSLRAQRSLEDASGGPGNGPDRRDPAAANGTGPSPRQVSSGGASSTAAPKARTSKASKRALALKGSKAAGPKMSLAEIRAKNRSASGDTGQTDDQVVETVATSVKSREGSSSDKPAVKKLGQSISCAFPSSPFTFQCSSPLLQALEAGRTYMTSLMSKPFDQVMQAFGLPNHADADAPTMYFSIPGAKCPMLYPEADRPQAKFRSRPTVDASWPILAHGLDLPWTHTGTPARSSVKGKGRMSSQNSSSLSGSSPAMPSSGSATQRLSRRKKANMNNIHHPSNADRWTPAANGGSSVQQTRQTISSGQEPVPGLDHPTTSSWIFPDEHICLFCEYELFYGERPRFLKACKHRRRTLRARRNKASQSVKQQSQHSQTCRSHHRTGQPSDRQAPVTNTSVASHDGQCKCGKSRRECAAEATHEPGFPTPSSAAQVEEGEAQSSQVAGEALLSTQKHPGHHEAFSGYESPVNLDSTAFPSTGLGLQPSVESHPQLPLAPQSRLNPWDVLAKYGLPPPLPLATRAKLYDGPEIDPQAAPTLHSDNGDNDDNGEGVSAHCGIATPNVTTEEGSSMAAATDADLNLDFPTSYNLTTEQRRSIAVSRSLGPQYLAKRLLRAMESFTRNRPREPHDPVWVEFDLAREAVPFEMMKEVVGETKKILSSMKQTQARATADADSDDVRTASQPTEQNVDEDISAAEADVDTSS
ncbi:unnamed protein product [Parajaminaea phylloscopi]